MSRVSKQNSQSSNDSRAKLEVGTDFTLLTLGLAAPSPMTYIKQAINPGVGKAKQRAQLQCG